MDHDSVQTLSIKGLHVADDQRSAYSIEAPSTPPPSYMKVTASSKVKVAKIAAGTLLLLTLLIGSFVLGGVYLSKDPAECKKASAPVVEARLDFLKVTPTEAAAATEPAATTTLAPVKAEPEGEVPRKSKRRQERRRNKQKSSPMTPEKFFRSMNIPNLLRQIERATDDMAERIMERNRQNRIACIMARKQEESLEEPRGRFFVDDDEPRRRLIVAPDGNNLLDCDEILGDDFASRPGPMTRTVRTKTFTIPIMALLGPPPSPSNSENFLSLPPPPSPFNQPPPPPQGDEEEFTPRRFFFRPQQQQQSPMFNHHHQHQDEEPFQQSPSSPVIYKHPADAAPGHMFHHMLPRLPRK